MLAMFRDQPVFDSSGSGGSGGPTGSDSMPIGTIISYMGKTAPNGYLICDGAIYNISDYPNLSELFKNQFGSANYFGGSGSTTFAVPDMRNLFLRGYHGNATALSGNIGKKQAATQHPYLQSAWSQEWGGFIHATASPYRGSSEYKSKPNGMDSTIGSIAACNYVATLDDAEDSVERGPINYTSRPVNMAVLYCIKAI